MVNSHKTKLASYISMALFAILISASIVKSSLIYELRPSSLILQRFKQEIQEIQAYNSISKIEFGVYHYEDESVSGKVDISAITQNFNYMDTARMSVQIQDSSQVVAGKSGAMLMKYTFSFASVIGEDTVNSSGSFSIQSTDYEIAKSYSMDKNSTLITTVKIQKLAFVNADVKLDTEADSKTIAFIEAALNKFLVDSSAKLVEAYNSDIQNYYSNTELKSENKKAYINFQSKDPSVDFQLDITPDRVPNRISDNSMVYYMSGSLNGKQSSHKEPVFERKDVYQILVNKQIFSDLLSDLTFEGLLDFTLTQENRPPNTQFNLDIQFLGKVIPDLLNVYPPTDRLQAWSKVQDVKVTTTKDKSDTLQGSFTLVSEIYHEAEMKTLLKFQSQFIFKIKHTLNQEKNTIDFFLDHSSLDITKLTIDSPKYPVTYKTTLKKWVESTLKIYLFNNNYSLLSTPLKLSPFFETVTSVTFDQEGYRIYGSPSFNVVQDETQVEEEKTHTLLKFLS